MHYFNLDRGERPVIGFSNFFKILEVADPEDFYMELNTYM